MWCLSHPLQYLSKRVKERENLDGLKVLFESPHLKLAMIYIDMNDLTCYENQIS